MDKDTSVVSFFASRIFGGKGGAPKNIQIKDEKHDPSGTIVIDTFALFNTTMVGFWQ